MREIKLDRNYKVRSKSEDLYKDQFDEMVDLVIRAREANKISDEQLSILLGIALSRQGKTEIKNFFTSIFGENHHTEKRTMYMELKHSKLRHA